MGGNTTTSTHADTTDQHRMSPTTHDPGSTAPSPDRTQFCTEARSDVVPTACPVATIALKFDGSMASRGWAISTKVRFMNGYWEAGKTWPWLSNTLTSTGVTVPSGTWAYTMETVAVTARVGGCVEASQHQPAPNSRICLLTHLTQHRDHNA